MDRSRHPCGARRVTRIHPTLRGRTPKLAGYFPELRKALSERRIGVEKAHIVARVAKMHSIDAWIKWAEAVDCVRLRCGVISERSLVTRSLT